MTGKDKTEDQLLASIRKNMPVATAVARKKTAKKASPRKTTATGPGPKSVADRASGSNYQSGRRVWPD